MSRVKRQDRAHYKTTSSPWANQSWTQQNAADTNNRSEDTRDTHTVRAQVKRTIRPSQRRCIWNPSKYERSPSSSPSPPRQSVRAPRIGLHHHSCPYYPDQFHQDIYFYPPGTVTPESSRPRRSMRDEDESSPQDDIDENTLQAANFTPLKPAETDGVPSANDEPDAGPTEETEGEDDSDWDKEGSKEHRDLLRSQPESFDEDGLRRPIYGVLSPPARALNANLITEQHAQAAQEQGTPSRPPRTTSLTKATSQLPSQPADEDDAESSAEAQPSPAEREAARRRTIEEGTVKFNEDFPVTHTKPESEIPIQNLENLTLEPVGPYRTPKSRSHQEAQEEIKKRKSERLARLKAAQEAYPLVPLSESWDAKVRQAINRGHGRFEASMFARCVPEYSNNSRSTSAWLDDAVINDYILMVAKHGSQNNPTHHEERTLKPGHEQRISALSSYFYTKISSRNPNYASCARMVKKAGLTGTNLLLCETVFIPINLSLHWFLAVIEPSQRRLTIYNSMGTTNNREVAAHIMNWIRYELGKDFDENEWEVDAYGESPQQKNGIDCGVFTCTTARQFMLGRYQDFGLRYKEPVIKDMRKRIVAELVNEGLLNKEESES